MSSSTTFVEPNEIGTDEDRERIDAVAAQCLEHTLTALLQADVATEHEARELARIIQDTRPDQPPRDLLLTLAKMQGSDEEHMSPAITRLSEAVASTMASPAPLIPFAGKLIAPSSFYESFQNILAVGRTLLVPVVYAEDTDAIGVASINPIAAHLLAGEIYSSVDRRFAIKPFMTIGRLDYESWSFLIRKHFAL
jgi:hypothetical protein